MTVTKRYPREKLRPRALDELRIRLLLENLIDDACHYSRDGDGGVEVRLFGDAETVTLEVCDEAVGIAADELPRLTEAFYRPDGARGRDTGAYGVGLYLCKLFADTHNGRVTITVEPRQGTRVSVDLPRDNS